MEKHHMVKPGSHILVGLSGGADSVCLFFLLHRLSKEMDFRVSAVHVNHMLRGETADSDSSFVKELSKKLDKPCYVCRVPVGEIAKKEKMSLEEAGRTARYQMFFRIAEEIGADSIALAHHKNDQSETMLFHLARGCGISGLRGIRPVRKDEIEIIRPLLCVERNEIEAYLMENKISYVNDETNKENLFSRNKIRNRIIPLMEQELCDRTVEHMAHTAELLGEAEDFLIEMTGQAFNRVVIKDMEKERLMISLEELQKEHPYLRGTIMKQALEQLANANKDLEKVHVEKLLELCRMPVGKRIFLPYGITAKKSYEELFLEKDCHGKEDEEKERAEILPIRFQPPKEGEVLEIPLREKMVLMARVMSHEEFVLSYCKGKKEEVPKKPYTKWFDCDKIKGYLAIRFRETGDYFYLNETDKKTVKSYFINEKVPREERDSIYLVSEEEHVLWITGYRISHYYKVNKNTSRILEITIRGGFTNGRESQGADYRRGIMQTDTGDSRSDQ
ncbi:MAG: tRNA lysidine(34) synthetase TilS [Lachnospiraceae bacterium]|nr:tRNA lysidine(34) synthetase TilS [Lachnospiraceae bacterium]